MSQVFLGQLFSFQPRNGNGNIVLDPQNGIVSINGVPIANDIPNVQNAITSLQANDTILFATTNQQSNDIFNQGTYFNQINVAIQGLDEAVINDQLNITQLQTEVNILAFNYNSAENQINDLQNQIGFKDQQEFYVSADGNDITGSGSVLQPFQTIQRAITQAELICSPSNQCSIYVGAGNYTENILISKGYISIIGTTSTAVQSSQYGITGDISLNITDADDLFQNFTILQGLVVRGSVVDNSTKEHSLTLQDCRIVVPNTRSYAVKVVQNTVDKRVRLINVQIIENDATAFTDSLVEVQGGWLYMERCDLTTKSVISAVELGAGSYLPRMALCSIECSSSSVSLPPQIFFNQDLNPPNNTIQSIGQTTIVAPNGGGATGANGLNTAIHIRTGVATTTFSIYGVICGIANNPFGNDIITNFHGLAVNVIYADFFALPGTAHKFGANLTKVALTPVN